MSNMNQYGPRVSSWPILAPALSRHCVYADHDISHQMLPRLSSMPRPNGPCSQGGRERGDGGEETETAPCECSIVYFRRTVNCLVTIQLIVTIQLKTIRLARLCDGHTNTIHILDNANLTTRRIFDSGGSFRKSHVLSTNVPLVKPLQQSAKSSESSKSRNSAC